MSFQVSDLKERNFLDLLNNNFNPLKLSNIKGNLWLQHFSHSNSLCAKATKAIINHTSIGKYRLKFFSREDFLCSCSLYPIKSWQHILYDCKRFNNYWNLRKDSIAYFTLFLKHNNKAFSFRKDFVTFLGSLPS